MPELMTPRLRCSPLQLDDWPFFLALQQDPQVMLYVADPRPVADIREAFDSRLPLWSPGAAHWLCLVVRDRFTHAPLGLTGYQHHAGDSAEVGFHQEGELRECYWLNGRWHNDWLFGLLRREHNQPGPSGE